MSNKINISKKRNPKGVFLPYRLIEDACRNRYDRSLAIFVMLKLIYKNSVFYDFSSRKVADKIKISHVSLLHHLNKLEKLGLIEWINPKNSGKQLRLRGYSYLKNLWKGRMIFIEKGDSKAIKDQLEYNLVKSNIKSQEHQIKRNSNGTRAMCQPNESISNYVRLSEDGIARLYGSSRSKARRIKEKLIKSGKVEFRQVWEKMPLRIDYLDFYKMRLLGYLPMHAKYEDRTKSVFIRLADSVALANNNRLPYNNGYIPFIKKCIKGAQ